MIPTIEHRRRDLHELCRRHGVARLDIFGSAARGADFDPTVSDLDFLVELRAPDGDPARLLDLRDALEALFGRAVDLVERGAVEQSRNYIRRRRILQEAEAIYAE